MLRRLRTAAERAHGQRARSEPESGVPSKLLRCARGVPDRHWMRCTSPVSSERLQYFFSSVVSFMHLPTQRGHQRLRHLGITSAAALIVGNMIGAGVITTSGFAPADLGRRDLVLQAWGVGGLLALCGALSCGTLARRIPESGGASTRCSPGPCSRWPAWRQAGYPCSRASRPRSPRSLWPSRRISAGRSLAVALAEWIGTAAILAAGLMHGLQLRKGSILQKYGPLAGCCS